PLQDKLSVQVVVAGTRSKIANLIVDLKYEDPKNHVREFGTVMIDQSNITTVPVPWVVSLADPTNRRYSYSQTLIDTDGNVVATGWVQEERTTLLVGDVYVKRWEVQPTLV